MMYIYDSNVPSNCRTQAMNIWNWKQNSQLHAYWLTNDQKKITKRKQNLECEATLENYRHMQIWLSSVQTLSKRKKYHFCFLLSKQRVHWIQFSVVFICRDVKISDVEKFVFSSSSSSYRTISSWVIHSQFRYGDVKSSSKIWKSIVINVYTIRLTSR